MYDRNAPPVGASPGTLSLPAGAPRPVINVIRFDAERVDVHPNASAGDLVALLTPGTVTWVDISGLGDEGILRAIGDTFGLHPLALADLVNVPQRPKTEAYADHQLFITRQIRTLPNGNIEDEQVGIVVGPSWVLTFQERPGDILDPVRSRIRGGHGRMRTSGPDYLAYALIDTIVDGYFPVMEALGETLEDLEDQVMARPTPQLLRVLHEHKRLLLDLRRAIWPQRDALNALVRGDSPLFTESVRVYLRDTHDHCMVAAELTEAYRELVSGLMNTYLSVVSNKMSEIMQVLTVLSSIFIPLTFVAGVYGMNFEYMPELRVWWAYPLLGVLMITMAGGMLLYFRRKGWLRRAPRPPVD